MSGWNPQIADWMTRGLEWQYIDRTIMRQFTIDENSQFQLPRDDYTFSYPEGVLIQFSAAFDHPLCGIRIEAEPNFDTGTIFTANQMTIGVTPPDILVYAMQPPVMPPGMYGVRVGSPWAWKTWLRIYLINTDSVPHRVMGHGYHMAVLRDPRRVTALEAAE